MTSVIKNRNLENEPLDDKNVTALPGVGQASGGKLINKNITKASQLYSKIFLPYKNNKIDFTKKMKEYCNARKSNSLLTYDFFNGWHSKYGTNEEYDHNEENSNDDFERPPSPDNPRPCLRNRIAKPGVAANAKKAVHFKKSKSKTKSAHSRRKSSSEETDEVKSAPTHSKKQDNFERFDPLTQFFLSTLEPVKSFPRPLQIQVKKQVFDIVHDAETTLAARVEPEPVASTSYINAGYSLEPQPPPVTPVPINEENDA